MIGEPFSYQELIDRKFDEAELARLPPRPRAPRRTLEHLAEVLEAMRAHVTVDDAESGLWTIKRFRHRFGIAPNGVEIPPGIYTYLFRATMETLHKNGELVMADHPAELATHLNFVLKARGRILVTGLGLGCVLRGLVHVGRASSIEVVERDPFVLHLCRSLNLIPGGVTVYEADALEFDGPGPWDFVWHDLWNDPDTEEGVSVEPLSLTHFRALVAYRDRAERQGAWALKRWIKRRYPELVSL